jgi:thioredoxin 1
MHHDRPTHDRPTSRIPALDATTFDESIRAAERTVLVDVWAAWCAPCRTLAPELAALAADHPDALEVYALDHDAHPEVGRRYGVMSLPTVLVFRDGELVDRLVGARSRARLRDDLSAVLG